MSIKQWVRDTGEKGVQALQRAYWKTQHPTQHLLAAYTYLTQEGRRKDAADLLIDIAYYYPYCLDGSFPDSEQGNLTVPVSLLLETWDDLATNQCSTKAQAIALVRRVQASGIDRTFARRFFAHYKYNRPSYFVDRFPILWFRFELCRRGHWLDLAEKHATLTTEEQTEYPLSQYLAPRKK